MGFQERTDRMKQVCRYAVNHFTSCRPGLAQPGDIPFDNPAPDQVAAREIQLLRCLREALAFAAEDEQAEIAHHALTGE